MISKLKELMNKITKAGLLHFVRNDNTRKKMAFTLAEVLITLGIIGVVAALTLPTLMKSYQKKVTVEKLKSTYAILQQAIRLSEVDNGPYSSWEVLSYDGDVFFDRYIKNYLKLSKDEVTAQPMSNKITFLNGTHPSGDALLNLEKVHKYTLYNGATIFVWMASLRDSERQNGLDNHATVNMGNAKIKNYVSIFVDLNGDKKPNKLGRDIFSLIFAIEKGLHFTGEYSNPGISLAIPEPNRDREYIKSNNCNKNDLGYWCGLLIKVDGWKISKDYPW